MGVFDMVHGAFPHHETSVSVYASMVLHSWYETA